MKHTKKQERGFSLVELIGVLAVIAILAAMVAPKVFDVIEDAKVATLVENINQTKAVVARFYKDTGLHPSHDPATNTANTNQLIRNDGKLLGWQGPYIDEELASPFATSVRYLIISGANGFDIDGDGNNDYKNSTALIVDGLTAEQALAINEAIDGDAANGKWFASGKVRTAKKVAPRATALSSQSAGDELYIMIAGY